MRLRPATVDMLSQTHGRIRLDLYISKWKPPKNADELLRCFSVYGDAGSEREINRDYIMNVPFFALFGGPTIPPGVNDLSSSQSFFIIGPFNSEVQKCNGESFGVEENLTRSSVADYLSGARVEFILDCLDIGI
jgi:hypothetical protein